jgi:hypothetical protein
MQEAHQLDLILVPVLFWEHGVWQRGIDPTEPAELRSAVARSSGTFRARLEEAELVEDRGVVSSGPHEVCAVQVLAVRSPPIAPEVALRLKPLRPEVHVGSAP